jgi:hypothetical protein
MRREMLICHLCRGGKRADGSRCPRCDGLGHHWRWVHDPDPNADELSTTTPAPGPDSAPGTGPGDRSYEEMVAEAESERADLLRAIEGQKTNPLRTELG